MEQLTFCEVTALQFLRVVASDGSATRIGHVCSPDRVTASAGWCVLIGCPGVLDGPLLVRARSRLSAADAGERELARLLRARNRSVTARWSPFGEPWSGADGRLLLRRPPAARTFVVRDADGAEETAVVRVPRPCRGYDAWWSLAEPPAALGRPDAIVGGTPAQALDLADRFLRMRLEAEGVRVVAVDDLRKPPARWGRRRGPGVGIGHAAALRVAAAVREGGRIVRAGRGTVLAPVPLADGTGVGAPLRSDEMLFEDEVAVAQDAETALAAARDRLSALFAAAGLAVEAEVRVPREPAAGGGPVRLPPVRLRIPCAPASDGAPAPGRRSAVVRRPTPLPDGAGWAASYAAPAPGSPHRVVVGRDRAHAAELAEALVRDLIPGRGWRALG
jgi:hypothetical protein